jgi:hypothetical protein
LEMDKKVYPTSSPVTKEIIKRWYINNPEFGAIFEKNKKMIGVLIAIPLNKQSWRKLIRGKLKESEMSKKTIFDNSKDKEIGIHIYHIEKVDKNTKNLYKIALKLLIHIFGNLKKENHKLKLIGFSGLCVTPEGINLFEKKFKCKEKDFIVQEHILEKKRKKIILETDSRKVIQEKINEGYNYLIRYKMLVAYPDKEHFSEIINLKDKKSGRKK